MEVSYGLGHNSRLAFCDLCDVHIYFNMDAK